MRQFQSFSSQKASGKVLCGDERVMQRNVQQWGHLIYYLLQSVLSAKTVKTPKISYLALISSKDLMVFTSLYQDTT